MTTTTILNDLRDPQNTAAWEKLIRRFRGPILGFARRMGISDPNTEDVAQETLLAFVEAYRKGNYDRSKGRLSRWLFGIAYRRILRQQEKEKHSRRIVSGDAEGSRFWEALPDQETASSLWDTEWEGFVLRACIERVRQEFEPTTVEAFSRSPSVPPPPPTWQRDSVWLSRPSTTRSTAS
jgi:RNA polymerase sigma factor (sigma-70 family)